jgi:hypothetical protein
VPNVVPVEVMTGVPGASALYVIGRPSSTWGG